MSLLVKYLELGHEIKCKALLANNLVSNYIEHHNIDDDSYRVSWCGISEAYHLDLIPAGDKVILEYDDGDGYPTTWDVPTKWLDMSDEDIIKDYLVELERRKEIDKMTSIQKLERQANELGFCLVKQ